MAAALAQVPPIDGGRWVRLGRDRQRRLPRAQRPDADPGGAADERGHDAPAANAARGCRRHQRSGQLHRVGASFLPDTGNSERRLAPTAGFHGIRPAGRPSRRSCASRRVRSSPSPGTGVFLMNGQEFATAVQYGANVVCLVVNNRMLGTIRMHQERHFPGRVSATDLVNPGLRGLRARVRGLRGDRRANRGVPRSVRARPGERQARDPRAARGPRSAHARAVPQRDSSSGVGPQLSGLARET